MEMFLLGWEICTAFQLSLLDIRYCGTYSSSLLAQMRLGGAIEILLL